MVQEVRIISEEEYRQRQSASAFIVFMIVMWGVATYLDQAFLEPFIEWLEEGGWPTWWLWLLETCMSIPAYMFGDEKLPLVIREMNSSSSTVFQILALVMMGIGLIMLITYPYALLLVAMITPFLALGAGVQILAGMIGWILASILSFVLLCVLSYAFGPDVENNKKSS